MEETLLKTKVRTPQPRPGLVQRTRPMERFGACLNADLVLVSAPAGFGKTTLLSQWIHASKPRPRVAWFSLDGGDNDPVRFWSYLIASLQTFLPATGINSLALLRTSQQAPMESVLTALINDLSPESEPVYVVLDDYHLISNTSIHNGIIFLLENMPAALHLVIVTRADPPLPLARFRGKGLMAEVGADELRFTHDEAAGFFDEPDEPALSREDVEALNLRTEGWAVGLKMAAISLRKQKNVASFMRDFTGTQRYVMDYLMEEVLNRQTPDVRNFLLETSVLEKLCAPLCDYVTDLHAGLRLLAGLERDNLFLVSLDEAQVWYRYEHLFANFLQHQLEVEYGRDRVGAMHCRAGQWYENNDFPDEAIEHYLMAYNWEQAVRLIKEHCPGKLRNGEFHTVLNWVKQLPERIRSKDFFLNHEYAVALMSTGDLKSAESVLDQIDLIAAEGGVNVPVVTADLRSMIALFQGDISRALTLGQQALAELPPESGGARSGVGLTLGVVYASRGQLKQSEAYFLIALEDASRAGNKVNINVALNGLAGINTLFGNLHKAADQYRQALENTGHPLYIAKTHLGLAGLIYEWNDFEHAERHLERTIELSRTIGAIGRHTLAKAYYEMARIDLIRGDEGRSAEALEAADRLVADDDFPHFVGDDTSTNMIGAQAANHVRIAILCDDMDSLTKWENPLYQYLNHIPLLAHIAVRAAIAHGAKDDANQHLKAMEKKMLEMDATYGIIITRVYQAMAAPGVAEAIAYLTDALALAEHEGYIRTFADEGRLLAPLLQKAALQGVSPDYATRLLDIISVEQRRYQKTRSGQATARGSESLVLNEREIDVLRQAADGLSNKEIAEKLIISLNTVKTHLKHIYDKLDVNGRSQAITRARKLRII